MERTLDGMAGHLLDIIERRDLGVKVDALSSTGALRATLLANVLRRLTDREDAPPLVLVIDEYDLLRISTRTSGKHPGRGL